jgi:putative Ca2+/H+ antiporter (TMEM165/GDT1 family)
MLVADVPAVFVGDKFAARIPMRWVHGLAAGVFVVLGVLTLWGADDWFGWS